MRGNNPAWIIPISEEQQIATAILSGEVIRRYSPEPLVAFVSRCIKPESIIQLQDAFDHVILAPDSPNHGKDFLLVETLKLTLFSTLVVVRDGALVFWKFDEALETGAAFLQSNSQENNWLLVAVTPDPERYSAAVSTLQEGIPFDSKFIMDSIVLVEKKGLPYTIGFSWSDLKYYDGLKMPLVQLSSEIVKQGLHNGDDMVGFWKKKTGAALAPPANSEEKIDIPVSPRGNNVTNKCNGIAIVGLSCRFPGANSVEEYWQVLSSGVSTASRTPSNRLGISQVGEETIINFLKCPIDEFDASFFEIPPNKAAFMDPQTRFLLEVSWEAFQDARINPEKLRAAPVGVFYGSWAQEYKDLLNWDQRTDEDFLNKYIGNSFGCTAAKLSFFYGFTGPNLATESGCASSLLAVKQACESLEKGECPVALAAGANVILQMDSQHKVVWAPDGTCRSFDSQANGYGRAEGVGVLVLKRYSDAIRDGDRIHGLILGSASCQEGLTSSFATPTVEIEAKTMRSALVAAKVHPKDVDYVEAHATGTGVGDPIEADAIVAAYSSSNPRKAPLLVGSVKTNIGHAESCSGIASIIKVLLALKHETIPAHINVNKINIKVDFSPIPGKLTLQNEPWKRSPQKPRIAGVSNFGISGTDVHTILQEPPQQLPPQCRKADEAQLHILTFSAKSSAALDQLVEAYQTLLEQSSDTLADITYTTNVASAHLRPFRRALVSSTKDELIFKLKERKSHSSTQIDWKGMKVGFTCDDDIDENDWEQYAALYSQFPAFQISMDVCNAVCKDIMDYSPVAYLLNNKVSSSSSSLSWERMEQRQACSFSVTYSLYKLWESWGVKGSAVLGLNFGELVGAAITGELELAQCFQLILHKNAAAVLKKGKSGPKPGIRYISADKGGHGLDMEHWAKMCSKKNDSCDQLATALEKTDSEIIIHLNIKGNLEMKRGLHLPPTGTTGLAGLLTSLATLYETGYPVDWEGFQAHQIGNKVSLPGYPFQRKSLWFKKGQSAKPEAVPSNPWNSNSVHPLLGSYISREENSKEVAAHIFENQLVAHEHAPYLAAHVIGSEMIFPATAHLELLLAASNFQSVSEMPLIVENFLIHLPLQLHSSSAKPLRTSMVQIETGWNIVVESQTESEIWKRYASSDITLEKGELPQHPNLEEFQRRLVVKNEGAAIEFYEKIAQVGLNFGKEFKSLKSIYESESANEILVEVVIPRDAVHYVCHPLLADAMLQCFIFQKHVELNTLMVPVGISKFICHRRLRPSDCSGAVSAFIYLNEQLQTVFLLDSNGAPIASMTEPQLKETTVRSVLAAAGCAPKKTRDGELDIWQVDWNRATKYQSEGSLTLGLDFTQSPSFIDLVQVLERHNVFRSSEEEQFSRHERLSELFVFKAFHELGWKPKQGESVLVSELAAELHIAPNFLFAFRYFLSYFENNGVVQLSGQMENATLKVLQLPEEGESVENLIAQLLQDLHDYEPIQSFVACASVLAPVMQGKRKGQQILFDPRKEGVTHADILYKGDAFYKKSAEAVPKIFLEIATQLWDAEGESGQGKRLRILEIGGGTGVFTSAAIPLLEGEGIEYCYHFTDISSQFLIKAASQFPHLIYKTFDLDKDPLQQGFPPAYFDIVVGLDVVHATKNLRRSVRHLKMLLKTGGHLLLGETSAATKTFDVTFGILDGYWNFEDHDVRSTHCTIPAEQWLDLLSESGFRGPSSSILLANNHLCVVVATLSHPQLVDRCPELMKTWLLLHDKNESKNWLEEISKRMSNLGRQVISYEIESSADIESCISDGTNLEGILCLFQDGDASLASNNCRILLEPMLQAAKFLIKRKSWTIVPRLCVATSGLWMECESESNPSSATVWGFMRCARMELPWLTTKLVDLDPDIELELRMESLLQEIWMGDDETEAVYRGGIRYTRRLNLVNPETKHRIVAIPNNCKDYSVLLPTSKLLQDVLYVPKTMAEPAVNQVIVEVRATSLNFKDVLHVMKPTEDFKEMNNIGIDFAGVVSAVGTGVTKLRIGTPVFGVSMAQSTISGYISSLAEAVEVIPPNLTFAEAATLPVAFITGWHCLVDVAHASSGQTILIHAASGGVGLVAIQIAKHLGLNIVATAGSQKKRKFLRNLGIPHVFNSRTLEFGQQIKGITNGDGVDIVLNCLTGPGFKETSLEICKKGGHFVEMSKLDIWEEHEVKARKPGVNYKIVDMSVAEHACIARLLSSLSKMLKEGFLKPLPYTRFTASRVVSALQFLQKAKQIGKVVVEMPHFDLKEERFKERLFNDQSTYLITGGKGAIGLAIAEWMVASHGAKYLVLLGRSPPNEKALGLIQKLEQEAGAKILSMEGDVADFHQMKSILEKIQKEPNLPPLRGIHHCAGVLSDDMVVNQDWASFDYSLNPKVKGSYNLHMLTGQIPLEFFVVHSSMTCVIGSPGQTNYSSGCLYTEALMESRVRNGLPGMAISWGHWNAGLAENREVEIAVEFSIPQGIAALEKFFLENRASGGAGFMKASKICMLYPGYKKTFFKAIPLDEQGNIGGGESGQNEETQESLQEAYKQAGEDEKMDLIRNVVKNTLCDTLGITFQEVGEHVQFATMGLDSLMSIEFYNKLQSLLGKIELGYVDMEQYGTVDKMSTLVKAALDKALA